MVLDKFFVSAMLYSISVPHPNRQNKESTMHARAGPVSAVLQVYPDIAIIGAGG
ncbi:MAG: hypothetical protein HZB11_02565 [Candidatus Yonathbacteria bacterium]|nr:hypothetical protein [Candidatus Yonathbacteria bacterium]